MNGRTITVVLALVVTGVNVAHADELAMFITATDANGSDTKGSVTIPANTTTTIKWQATGVVPGSCRVLKDHPVGAAWSGISEKGEQVTGQFTSQLEGRTYTLQCTNASTKAAVKSGPVTIHVSGSVAPK